MRQFWACAAGVMMGAVLALGPTVSKASEETATPAQSEGAGGEEIATFTENDDKGSASLSVGQRFAIKLPVQMGTGYSWKVSRAPEGVKTIGDKAERSASEGVAPQLGGSGQQVFEFSVDAPGGGAIDLQYVRPWENDVPAAKTFTLNLEVAS